jgi:hypothetical protein
MRENQRGADLLRAIREVEFFVHDLGLYLNVQPNDSAAKAQFDKYSNMLHDLIMRYSREVGPLFGSGIFPAEGSWACSTPFPWEN